MARLLVALLALLALVGCDWGGAAPERNAETRRGGTGTTTLATAVPVGSSPTERVVEAIRSCEVTRIIFGHGEKTYVTFRGRERTINYKSLGTDEVAQAVERANACNIVVGIE